MPKIERRKKVKTMKPNFYKQYDSRWASYTLKGCNIARNGCGPTSIANIASKLTKSTVTPKTVFKYMVRYNFIDPVNGSYWNGITESLKYYGIKDFTVTGDSASAKKALKKGHWLIGVVTRSRWTYGGHYILVYDLNGSKVLVSDSASSSSYRQKEGLWSEYAAAERMQWIDIDPKKYRANRKRRSSKTYTLFVSDAKANIRKGRSTNYGVKAIVKRGVKLKLYSYRDGWYRIKSGKHKGYYIHESTLSKYKPYVATFKTLAVMNVRDGYSTIATKIIRTIPKGKGVRSSKKKGNWIYVPALKGWICIKRGNEEYLKEL